MSITTTEGVIIDTKTPKSIIENRAVGCLVGAACGDALGVPHEFKHWSEISDVLEMIGGGPHMCLGNALARIELIIMFEDIIRRIDKMERTAELDYVHSNFIHGIKSMPVKVTLR